MRIAVVTNAFPPDARGGAGVIAADLVDLWRAQGHEVRVWAHAATWLRSHALRRLCGHLFDDRWGGKVLVTEVLAWKPEVVITHNLTGIGWTVGRQIQATGVPWVHVLHDVQLFEPSGTIYQEDVTWWQRGWSAYRRPLFGTPDRLVSPTRWLLEQHEKRGWNIRQGVVLPNPAPEVGVHPEFTNPEAAWTCIGHLTDQKGFATIDALARLRPNAAFTVIGDGPWRHVLGKHPNVRCLGQVPRELVLRELAHARGVLVPSRVLENQPTVILEAFSLGVPVIAVNRGGVPETVGEGGHIVSLEPARWVEAMDDIDKDPRVWSERACEAELRFDRKTITVKWGAMLLSLKRPEKTHTPTPDLR